MDKMISATTIFMFTLTGSRAAHTDKESPSRLKPSNGKMISAMLRAYRPPMESDGLRASGRRFHGKESSTLDSIRELG